MILMLPAVKDFYVIENQSTDFKLNLRHKIEQRWFSAIKGSFRIPVVKLTNWDNPSDKLEILLL
jgi:hypothetical protein